MPPTRQQLHSRCHSCQCEMCDAKTQKPFQKPSLLFFSSHSSSTTLAVIFLALLFAYSVNRRLHLHSRLNTGFHMDLDDEYVLRGPANCLRIHGTTIVAFFYENGIMLGMDTRESIPPVTHAEFKKMVEDMKGDSTEVPNSRRSTYDNTCKWVVKGNIIMIFSGRVKDMDMLKKWLFNGQWPKPITGQSQELYSVEDVVTKASEGMNLVIKSPDWMNGEKRLQTMTNIIAGWSYESEEPELWSLHANYNQSTSEFDIVQGKKTIAFAGSGCPHAARSFELQETGEVRSFENPKAMRDGFLYNMKKSEEDAKKVVFRCLSDASSYDEFTGGKFQVLKVCHDFAGFVCEKRSIDSYIEYSQIEKENRTLLMACTDSEEYEDVYPDDLKDRFCCAARATSISHLSKSDAPDGFYLYQVVFEKESYAIYAMDEAKDVPSSTKEGNRNFHDLFEKMIKLDTSGSKFIRSDEEEGRLKMRWIYLSWCTKDLLKKIKDSCVEIHKLRRR